MFKKLLLFVLVLGLVSSAQAALVHHWEFDGNASDSSGSGNTGTISGTASWVNGVDYWKTGSGQAINLNGSTYVYDLSASNLPIMATDDNLRTVDFTVNLYAYEDATKPDYEVMGGFGRYSAGGNFCAYAIARSGNIGFLRGHGTWYDIFTGSPVDQDKWTMVTLDFVRAGSYGTWKVYKNGVEIGSNANDQRNMADDVLVGWMENKTDANYWTGYIDGFQIYNHTLSSAERTSLYGRIPEPATIALLGMGGLLLLRRRR